MARVSDPRIRACGRLYQRGATMRELAGHFSVSESTIRRWLADAGVPARRPGPRAYINPALVAEMRGEGWSYQQIADRIGMSKTAVRKAMDRWADGDQGLSRAA